MKNNFYFLLFIAAIVISCKSKPTDFPKDYSEFTNEEYWLVVSNKAALIVDSLKLEDESLKLEVQDLIAAQYYRLNSMYDHNNAEINTIQASKLAEDERIRNIELIQNVQQAKVQMLHD